VAGEVAGHGWAVQDRSGQPALVGAPRRLGVAVAAAVARVVVEERAVSILAACP
jgi:hypothetical protein